MKRRFFTILLALLAGYPLAGQVWWEVPQTQPAEEAAPAVSLSESVQRAIERGDSLHRAYCFQDAIGQYLSIQVSGEKEQASLDRKIAAAQNALNLTDFCADVHVVARQRFSRKDFFLFYPLQAQAWHPSPNPLDSLGDYPVYAPKGTDVIYFSARDRAGSRSLFITEDLDSLWRAPRLLGEMQLSTGSEIFPLLSPDGRTLVFASDGLSGMGGFDLFSSTWDEERAAWSTPVNLGFPFNSPADDFLLADTEDGKYTLFASNRDCSADSVYIYVLDFEAQRARKSVSRPADLRRLSELKPVEDPTRIDNASAMAHDVPSNANTRLYMRKMAEARALRDSIYRQEKALDELRLRLSMAAEDETAALSARIRDKESAIVPLRQLLEEVNLEISLVEQSFLQSGVVSSREDREVVGASQGYTFAKNSMGAPLRIRVARHPSLSSFRVMPVGRFALDNTLPAGVVYQIELFNSTRHATLEDIRGLSPVYERLGANLRYAYCVGVFSTYVQALLDLNTVRVLGFPDARIVAFSDGRPIPVDQARQEE